jgi:aminoglycoside 3'-phosphotransferase-1
VSPFDRDGGFRLHGTLAHGDVAVAVSVLTGPVSLPARDHYRTPEESPPVPTPLHVPDALQAFCAGRRWSPITDGESGAHVFVLEAPTGPARFLKHASDRPLADALQAERDRLQWLTGRVPVPRLLGFAREGATSYLLTEALPGRSASDALEHAAALGVPAVEALASTLGAWLRTLHELPIDACPFDASVEVRLAEARRRVADGLVDEGDFDEERQGWRAADVVHALEGLLPLPFERVLTHGDFSLDNVFVARGQVSGVLDVGRAGVADPYQDIAICWRDLGAFGTSAQSALLRGYGLHAMDSARCTVHLLLDELF